MLLCIVMNHFNLMRILFPYQENFIESSFRNLVDESSSGNRNKYRYYQKFYWQEKKKLSSQLIIEQGSLGKNY